MNTVDLITSFFNNELSPDQERQFLLSVASSDSLRLGLKSHVMLDRILHEEADKSRVSQSIRANVMKEAAIVAAAAGGLNGGDAFAKDRSASDSRSSGAPEGSGLFGRIPRWISAPLVLFLSVGSFLAGFYSRGDQDVALRNALPVSASDIESAMSWNREAVLQVPAVGVANEDVANPDMDSEGIEGENVTASTVSAPTAARQGEMQASHSTAVNQRSVNPEGGSGETHNVAGNSSGQSGEANKASDEGGSGKPNPPLGTELPKRRLPQTPSDPNEQ